MKIQVLIADDQTLFREALEQAISLEKDIEVIGGAADGEEAVRKALASRPEVILMDLKMPRMDGISATRRIKESLPGCRIVMMTLFGDEEYVHQAILAGADGYLLKDVRRLQVVEAIRQVHRNRCLIDPSLMRGVVDQYVRMSRGESAARPRPDGLTEREVEILSLVARGRSNKEIADSLFLTVGTVKTHLYNVYQKIGVSDRTQAALYYIHKGFKDAPAESPPR
ncbi:MAG: response regulator transcription factor [Armatimonadetes bacterium]|nr:response regulator transcription factor [Armatimonadota bacterium]